MGEIDFYGRHLASRLGKLRRRARELEDPAMRFSEARVDLPLAVADEPYIHEQRELFQSVMGGGEKCLRFVDEWSVALRSELTRVTGDPVQAMRIGEAVLVGFANGNIGYVPTKTAFDNPVDYACHIAPMFYGLYSYTPEVADTLVSEMAGLVQALDSSN